MVKKNTTKRLDFLFFSILIVMSNKCHLFNITTNVEKNKKSSRFVVFFFLTIASLLLFIYLFKIGQQTTKPRLAAFFRKQPVYTVPLKERLSRVLWDCEAL
jgi:hypothetical protein